ncbi:MAG TPA: hypothetical protein VLA13_03580 [Massilibacterium sp.]|nr:hypothetical protein [Massilibacterium sp.]
MAKRNSYSGYTEKTAENLLLDAGAFFIDFDVETDDFDSAVAAGKLLGATRGGGSFSAVPEIRAIEVDGVHGKAKGLQVIDQWEIKMTASVLEVTREGLTKALTASEVDESTNTTYDIIKAKNYIDITDYFDNITYVGKISGADEPLIIQIYNAINSTGLTLETEDKSEAVTEMEFEGHYDESELDSPPFAIFYPKRVPIV